MSWHKHLAVLMTAFSLLSRAAMGQVFLNEILFAPPGPDIPCQYIELRGPPNYTLPIGTYVVSVSGDINADPGTLENVFDLSGQNVGGNGFLVLLQKTNLYPASPNATLLANTGSGAGFGSGSTSSIGHRGRSGRTELPHASVTFFLIQATNAPEPGSDIDGNNDGVPGGQMYRGWTILDSVGAIRNAGDIGYGAINFRQNQAGLASGVTVPVTFAPDYVGRTTNSTNSEPGSWTASANLAGTAPNWVLSPTQTVPPEFSGRALDHIGLPNFGAAAFPGIVAVQPVNGTDVLEGSGTGSYSLGLNTQPQGTVIIQIRPDWPVQVSADSGATFSDSCNLQFTTSDLRQIFLRAPVDHIIEASPHTVLVRHSIFSTTDPEYPTDMLGPRVPVRVFESESLIFSELKVNPPGTNDAPCEFMEISGPPGSLLTNVYCLFLDGDHTGNPGLVILALSLGGSALGSSGLLVVTGDGNPYQISTNTTVLTDARFNAPGGALKNGACSALLVSSPTALAEGMDLDAGDNGILEGLPAGSTILDAVAWTDGSGQDVLYGGVVLNGNGRPPDAMARFATNLSPVSAQAWFFGELAAPDCASLVFDGSTVSSNFPGGAVLSPGVPNSQAVQLPLLGPLSGVIGDPGNPTVTFTVGGTGTAPDQITVHAFSSNPEVVPDSQLIVTPGSAGQRQLFINPVGVGYATITVSAQAGTDLGKIAFPYAASAMGRPGGAWHTGTADGSTAISLDPDYMLVGDNENNVIRLYDRRRSGPPIREFDFQADLGLTPQEHGEVNIEASTRSGNRLYFIGAHSNSNSAQNRTNRNRLFALDLTGTGTNTTLSFVGRYDDLKPDLIQWDSNNGHGKGTNYYGFAASAADNINPKAPDGFNIEGLAMAPGSTNAAWIGFRAPIVPVTNRTYALIVPVLNFASLAAGGCPPGSAVFGAPIELDLYGRGFRSIEGSTNGYLICGGPPGDTGAYPKDFRLYKWTGYAEDQPQQWAADLTGTQPEGIAEVPAAPWTTNTQVQLISDNGTLVLYNDGIQDKHLPVNAFKKFRSDWVTLGATVKPLPILTGAAVTGDSVTITWRALKGEAYRVQSKSDLTAGEWSDASGDLLAAGPYGHASVSRIDTTQSFYRVRLLNP